MALPLLIERLAALPAFRSLTQSLPTVNGTLSVTGLAGSADAVLVAALAAAEPNRLFIIIADQLPEAERWLGDLQSVLASEQVALYPPREGFGEIEPHAEIAGERVETLEALARGGIRVLLTTARAVQERTRLPRALAEARLVLRRGESWRLEELTAHLDRVGFTRVPVVEDVAEYCVRGGIVDIYGFGMRAPVRLEFWGDQLEAVRAFDIATQRMTAALDEVTVLPVEVQGDDGEEAGAVSRVSLPDLWPAGALLIIPEGVTLPPEWKRTWDEAAHHLELARRRGEEVAARDALLEAPDLVARRLRTFPTLELRPAEQADGRTITFPIRPPEKIERDLARLGALVRDGTNTVILCDNPGQADRLEELLDGLAGDAVPPRW